MATALAPNKAKFAKRVIEVFEFFTAYEGEATVMDVANRYDRPQSSTSELMAALVEMGLLYRNPYTRSYLPTPRMASLGRAAQPAPIATGQLFAYMDKLAKASRHPVVLFGMVGPHLQIFGCSPGAELQAAGIECGSSLPLSDSAAGLLLLSTLGTAQARNTLWRLNAEAALDARLDLPALNDAVSRAGQLGHATGMAGFITDANVTAVLLPHSEFERPLALGVIYKASSAVDPDALVSTLNHGLGNHSVSQVETPAALLPAMFAM